MKIYRILSFLALTSFITNVRAWDTTVKLDAQHASTDNVNLTSTDPISDTYNTYGGYLQTKNDEFKFKLRGKTEKYNKQKENDNYSFDLSAQYKRTKTDDYTFAVFKQTYNGTPAVTTDTTSDNNGGRLAANFSHEYDKDTNGYFTITGTYKKYPKIDGRKDKILSGILGLEKYVTPNFLFNPEFNVQNNSSTDSYYENFSYGPSALISITPTDKWEIFADASFTHTNYSGRTVTTTTVRGKSTTKKEYQELLNLDAGIVYSLFKNVQLQAKYTKGKNNSNNSTAAYKANVLSFDISFKF
jgi:hypothetical protein